MTDREIIEARVRAFISDYADWERRCNASSAEHGPTLTPCEFIDNPDAWSAEGNRFSPTENDVFRRELEVIARKHCTKFDLLTAHGFAYGTPLRHEPEAETIVEVAIEGHRCRVKTTATSGRVSVFHYDLEKTGPEWRIARIAEFLGDDVPSAPPTWKAEDFRTRFSPHDDVGLALDVPFQGGAEAFNNETNTRGSLIVVSAGEVQVPSGVMIAADPAYASEARPLEVRTARTALPVELAQVENTNAFARVWLGSEREIAAYVPVYGLPFAEAGAEHETATDPLHVGTRCGAIVLADAAAWLGMSSHEADDFCDRMVDELSASRSLLSIHRLLPPQNQTPALVITRGGGDFSCPCYWGINRAGKPLALVIDFLICGAYVEESYAMPFTETLLHLGRPIPQLTEFGFTVSLVQEFATRIEVRSNGGFSAVDLIDSGDNVVASTERSGLMVSGTEHFHQLDCPDSLPKNIRLRVRWRTWRHEFARAL